MWQFIFHLCPQTNIKLNLFNMNVYFCPHGKVTKLCTCQCKLTCYSIVMIILTIKSYLTVSVGQTETWALASLFDCFLVVFVWAFDFHDTKFSISKGSYVHVYHQEIWCSQVWKLFTEKHPTFEPLSNMYCWIASDSWSHPHCKAAVWEMP